MQSDDTCRLKLQQLIASVKAWSGFVADVARVEVAEEGTGWRMALHPKAPGACPVEVVLDGQAERCDLRIARETYVGWRLSSLDLVLPLLEAIVEGHVVTRRVSSAATGLVLGVSTFVELANGQVLAPSHASSGGEAPLPLSGSGPVESRDIHYLPYRRG